MRELVKASSADQHTLHTMHTLHMVTAEPGEAHDARSQANPRPPKWFLCERAFYLSAINARGKSCEYLDPRSIQS